MAAGVLERAKMILTHELCATQKLYTRVILRYVCELCGDPLSHLSLSERRKQAANAPSTSVTSGDSAQGLRQFHLYEDERTAVFVDYTTACSGADTAEAEVEQLLPMVMLDGGSVYCGTDFVTGIVDMNRCIFRQDLPIEVRRRNLFGADQIVS